MPETASIQIMIMSGPDDGTLLKLRSPKQGEAFIIGRREDCDIMLPYDSQISRQHARLFKKDGKWYVQDLESRNGTFIGKSKLESAAPLEPGQMFRVGRTWLRLL
jgi:pSer/pThr/pTyr-binding forkhead associated (FHA) protein